MKVKLIYACYSKQLHKYFFICTVVKLIVLSYLIIIFIIINTMNIIRLLRFLIDVKEHILPIDTYIFTTIILAFEIYCIKNKVSLQHWQNNNWEYHKSTFCILGSERRMCKAHTIATK